MSRVYFSRETVNGWTRILPQRDLAGLGVIQRLIWSGRLADELLESTAIASGFRKRGDYEVLTLLRRLEPRLVTPNQVAQQLRTSPSGMTGKLDRLERQGLLQRIPDPDDRRTVQLGITDAGRTLIDEAFTINLNVYQTMLGGLTTAEGTELETLLEKLLGRLDELVVMDDPWDH